MTPEIIEFIKSVGIPGFILLVIVVAAWKALPAFIESQRAIAAAIPAMQASLQKMAEDGHAILMRLDSRTERIDARTDKIERKVTHIAKQLAENDNDTPPDGI